MAYSSCVPQASLSVSYSAQYASQYYCSESNSSPSEPYTDIPNDPPHMHTYGRGSEAGLEGAL